MNHRRIKEVKIKIVVEQDAIKTIKNTYFETSVSLEAMPDTSSRFAIIPNGMINYSSPSMKTSMM
jgi:hypothetical protein